MRGDIFMQAEVASVANSTDIAETAKAPEAATNLSENMKPAVKNSVWFWFGLFVLYLVWDWLQNREKIREAIEPANIRANIHNLAVIGLASVVFINGMNVFLSKLASMKIPGVSKVAGSLLPLFHL